jgi:hypothetical protein
LISKSYGIEFTPSPSPIHLWERAGERVNVPGTLTCG